MLTGSSSSQQAELGSVSISSIRQQVFEGLKASKEYRHGFIEEAIRSRIIAQITAMRKERGWDLRAFASQIGKKVSWAYRLEDPNSAAPTVPSLLEVAEAFDVGLDVRFRSFSELLDDVTTLGPESFRVPSFDEELKEQSFSRLSRRRKVRIRSHKSKPRITPRNTTYTGEGRTDGIGATPQATLALAS